MDLQEAIRIYGKQSIVNVLDFLIIKSYGIVNVEELRQKMIDNNMIKKSTKILYIYISYSKYSSNYYNIVIKNGRGTVLFSFYFKQEELY